MRRWLPFEWIAAVRFLLEGRMQSLFIVAGATIGVGVIVFMSAMLEGMTSNMMRRILNSQPHISMVPPDEVARPLRDGDTAVNLGTVQRRTQRTRSIDQWQAVRVDLERNPEITHVAPVVTGSVLASRGVASRSVNAIGIEPDRYFAIIDLPGAIAAGQPRLFAEDVVIGTDLAKELGVEVGDKVRFTAASGTMMTLTISGLFDLGNRFTNLRNVYMALRTGQALLGLIGGSTAIEVTVDDVYAAEDVAKVLQATTGVGADSWIKTNAQFFNVMNIQSISNTTIRLLVGLSVAFGIASVLIVSVVQRSKEIGILRAMGASRGQMLRVFLIQGGVLGLIGSIFGSSLGLVAIWGFHAIARNPDGSEFFPLIIDWWLPVSAAVIATATGVVAAVTPALRAARLDPVVAIRG
ncbi:ABC transporter permease [Pinisolibacter sp.]|uniref:ABC transporter permease n=1 Tax=Pinisolibacter sp. TaxID=2172024 RepID=UPI002FDEF063